MPELSVEAFDAPQCERLHSLFWNQPYAKFWDAIPCELKDGSRAVENPAAINPIRTPEQQLHSMLDYLNLAGPGRRVMEGAKI